VAFKARDIRGGFVEEENGTTVLTDAPSHAHTIRFPITTSEIQAASQTSGFVPFRPESPEENAQFDAMLLPVLSSIFTDTEQQGKQSPSGDFHLGGTAVGQGTTNLFIEEWTQFPSGNPPLILWDGRDGVPTTILTVQWSPDGRTIAMEDRGQGQPGGGSIYTQPASGASPPRMVRNISVKGQIITTYSDPIWSPDSKYLVVGKRQYTGTTLTGAWLTRLSLSDGKTLDLCPIVDAAKPLRWTADNRPVPKWMPLADGAGVSA